MAAGDHDDATLRGVRPRRRPSSRRPAATPGARGSSSILRGLGFADERARPRRSHVLRRRADARLAGARARVAPRPAAARRAHEPPRPRARSSGSSASSRRSTPPCCSSRTTAGSSSRVATGVLELERGRARALPHALLAPTAREKALQVEQPGRGVRAPAGEELARLRAVRRQVPRGHALAPGARRGRSSSTGSSASSAPRQERSLAFGFPKTERRGRVVIETEGLVVEVAERRARRRRRRSRRARPARRADRPERRRQDDARRDAARRAARARRGRVKIGHNVRARLLLAARVRSCATTCTVLEAMCRLEHDARRRPRPATCSAASCSRGDTVERQVEVLSGGERRRLVARLARRVAARTCSCSTSRRTTSTSRAARRSRTRSTPTTARSCWSRTIAR